MRDGYRIIDTDTHVWPSMEVLKRHADAELLAKWDEALGKYERTVAKPLTFGDPLEPWTNLSIQPRAYKREIGEKSQGEEELGAGGKAALEGKIRNLEITERSPRAGVGHDNSAGRLEDMDREGIDVHLLIPGTWPQSATVLPPDVADRALRGIRPVHVGLLLARPVSPQERADRDGRRSRVVGQAHQEQRRAAVAVVGDGDAAAGHADRRSRSRADLGGDGRCRSADPAPLLLLRAAVLPRLPRRVGQHRGRPQRRPPVGRPAHRGLPAAERCLRSVPEPAHRLLGDGRRLAAPVAAAPRHAVPPPDRQPARR